jgi:hypothetical protein
VPIVGLMRRPVALHAADHLGADDTHSRFRVRREHGDGARSAPDDRAGRIAGGIHARCGGGTSLPIHAGLGTTEAALIAVLVTAHVPAGHAVQVVLIFRLVAFWLPAVLGPLALRHLHRHHAI